MDETKEMRCGWQKSSTGQKKRESERLRISLLPAASLPLPPSLQLSVPCFVEFGNKLEMINNIAMPNPDVKEKEPREIFARILEANKGKSLDVHEGDILVTSGQSATTCINCLWPKSEDGTVFVPYTFGSTYSDWQLNLFKKSMEEYESLTCVRFVPRNTEDNYLNIVSSHGCASRVGQVGEAQMVGIDSNGCMYRGVIQHELNHALGFYHENMRSDRDKYVMIMYQNIAEDDLCNFAELHSNERGDEYDYQSVMHYHKFAFSNSSEKPTIVPIPDPHTPMGQKYGLSVGDVCKINSLYNCEVCAYLLNEKSGSLHSANYPSEYPNDTNCVWLVRTPSGQVKLDFVDFNIQSSPTCMSDYVRIYDGPTKKYPLVLDKTCGTGLIPPIIASTNQLLVEFASDSNVAGVGFKAFYSSVRCGGTFFTPHRTFTSPGYPYAYGSKLNCSYTITAPVGKKVCLTFSDFHTQAGLFCPFDYLQIRDTTFRWGPFCGDHKIPVITSKTNSMTVTLISDEHIEMRGFHASYKFI